ncbi:hypothetical protein MK805_09240 [Shimazuella sp. AN120528]|uniref:hypothetical protein n=1 Tax=Shimazuella soli TaxID=1892854 RepID=UPI001F0ED5BC|nr:hypothetical protein [Shimazuella soli]MCH5585153.1 hypothetical protein [Shimazuella soli]
MDYFDEYLNTFDYDLDDDFEEDLDSFDYDPELAQQFPPDQFQRERFGGGYYGPDQFQRERFGQGFFGPDRFRRVGFNPGRTPGRNRVRCCVYRNINTGRLRKVCQGRGRGCSNRLGRNWRLIDSFTTNNCNRCI